MSFLPGIGVSSSTRTVVKSRIQSPIWIIPLVIAAVVAAFGWWGNVRLRQTIEQQLKAQLEGTLEANVTALEIWMDDQKKLARELADEPNVRSLALDMIQKASQREQASAGRQIGLTGLTKSNSISICGHGSPT